MSYTLLYLISISRQAFKSVHIYLKEYIRLRLRMGNLVSYLYKGKLKEISLFYDKAMTSEVKGDIRFEPVAAGQKTIAYLYIHNNIDYPMEIEMELIGEDISLTKSISNLKGQETKQINLMFDPNLTRMKPITAGVEIKINYVIT